MSTLGVNSGTAKREGSSIARQLPLSPMRLLAIQIELALDVAVQRAHDTDPGN